ncbi:uncharacterized protein LOC143462325 [Clavelina lepadiformis]|uniref:uncharacterized protein LOC143462325 n=1 Tax=Clavelina lepadiformis TaxID=159417 RepID=UPI0040411269
MENNSRKRRRSSILKKSPHRKSLADIDPNTEYNAVDEDVTRHGFKRRVSFANTYQVKEISRVADIAEKWPEPSSDIDVTNISNISKLSKDFSSKKQQAEPNLALTKLLQAPIVQNDKDKENRSEIILSAHEKTYSDLSRSNCEHLEAKRKKLEDEFVQQNIHTKPVLIPAFLTDGTDDDEANVKDSKITLSKVDTTELQADSALSFTTEFLKSSQKSFSPSNEAFKPDVDISVPFSFDNSNMKNSSALSYQSMSGKSKGRQSEKETEISDQEATVAFTENTPKENCLQDPSMNSTNGVSSIKPNRCKDEPCTQGMDLTCMTIPVANISQITDAKLSASLKPVTPFEANTSLMDFTCVTLPKLSDGENEVFELSSTTQDFTTQNLNTTSNSMNFTCLEVGGLVKDAQAELDVSSSQNTDCRRTVLAGLKETNLDEESMEETVIDSIHFLSKTSLQTSLAMMCCDTNKSAAKQGMTAASLTHGEDLVSQPPLNVLDKTSGHLDDMTMTLCINQPIKLASTSAPPPKKYKLANKENETSYLHNYTEPYQDTKAQSNEEYTKPLATFDDMDITCKSFIGTQFNSERDHCDLNSTEGTEITCKTIQSPSKNNSCLYDDVIQKRQSHTVAPNKDTKNLSFTASAPIEKLNQTHKDTMESTCKLFTVARTSAVVSTSHSPDFSEADPEIEEKPINKDGVESSNISQVMTTVSMELVQSEGDALDITCAVPSKIGEANKTHNVLPTTQAGEDTYKPTFPQAIASSSEGLNHFVDDALDITCAVPSKIVEANKIQEVLLTTQAGEDTYKPTFPQAIASSSEELDHFVDDALDITCAVPSKIVEANKIQEVLLTTQVGEDTNKSTFPQVITSSSEELDHSVDYTLDITCAVPSKIVEANKILEVSLTTHASEEEDKSTKSITPSFQNNALDKSNFSLNGMELTCFPTNNLQVTKDLINSKMENSVRIEIDDVFLPTIEHVNERSKTNEDITEQKTFFHSNDVIKTDAVINNTTLAVANLPKNISSVGLPVSENQTEPAKKLIENTSNKPCSTEENIEADKINENRVAVQSPIMHLPNVLVSKSDNVVGQIPDDNCGNNALEFVFDTPLYKSTPNFPVDHEIKFLPSPDTVDEKASISPSDHKEQKNENIIDEKDNYMELQPSKSSSSNMGQCSNDESVKNIDLAHSLLTSMTDNVLLHNDPTCSINIDSFLREYTNVRIGTNKKCAKQRRSLIVPSQAPERPNALPDIIKAIFMQSRNLPIYEEFNKSVREKLESLEKQIESKEAEINSSNPELMKTIRSCCEMEREELVEEIENLAHKCKNLTKAFWKVAKSKLSKSLAQSINSTIESELHPIVNRLSLFGDIRQLLETAVIEMETANVDLDLTEKCLLEQGDPPDEEQVVEYQDNQKHIESLEQKLSHVVALNHKLVSETMEWNSARNNLWESIDKQDEMEEERQEKKELAKMKRRIITNLQRFIPWKLLQDSNHQKSFGFLQNTFIVHIFFNNSRLITSFDCTSTLPDGFARLDKNVYNFLHKLLALCISSDRLVAEYKSMDDLNKALGMISRCTNAVQTLHRELENVSMDYSHCSLDFVDTTVVVDFHCRAPNFCSFRVSFDFLKNQLDRSTCSSFQPQFYRFMQDKYTFGKFSETNVMQALQSVKVHSHFYFTRLVQAVVKLMTSTET